MSQPISDCLWFVGCAIKLGGLTAILFLFNYLLYWLANVVSV